MGKEYWKGINEINKDSDLALANDNEFAEKLPVDGILKDFSKPAGRRKFLKAFGFGLGAVTVASCTKAPVRKAIPYLVKPEELIPGEPTYYTSSINGTGILVKTMVGRPIKVEGNPDCIISRGGLSAKSQASVLNLYDNSRLKKPTIKDNDASWSEVEKKFSKMLNEVGKDKQIRFLSPTLKSPSTKANLDELIKKYSNAEHIAFDTISHSAILEANKKQFGKEVIPKYQFDKAELIVSFDADFLGSWLSPNEYSAQYMEQRNYKAVGDGKMSRHIQFESRMSVSGTNADTRIPLKNNLQTLALTVILAELKGENTQAENILKEQNLNAFNATILVATELKTKINNSLIVSGSNDVTNQSIVNEINHLLSNYGSTIDLDNPINIKGSDELMHSLVTDMEQGKVDFLCIMDTNPAYHYVGFSSALEKVKHKVCLTEYENETSVLCDIVAPISHYLESWSDAEPYKNYFTIVQPVINKVFNSRTLSHILRGVNGEIVIEDYDYVKNYWQKNILDKANMSFHDVLQKGIVDLRKEADLQKINSVSFTALQTLALSDYKANTTQSNRPVELSMYSSVAIGDGSDANNPLLQELPDPVTKVTWDNYLSINPKYAKQLKISENELVEISDGTSSLTLPALHQPGQAMETVAVALGYGRTHSGKVGTNVGKNIYPFIIKRENGKLQYATHVHLKPTGDEYILAQTQSHHIIESRDIIRETSLEDYKINPKVATKKDKKKKPTYDLWQEYQQPSHRWVMAIDLNACTGCGACIVACNTENNVPVVGRDEVRNRREMHWIRIDRYYSFKSADNETITEEREIDRVEDFENVSVVHQPMLCQHCDHAPCEAVCPVAATTHSMEGLNHMAYNRCVGTRYCANNCPYKVRRFNWFNYWNDEKFDNYLNNEFAHLSLNPDVTPRFRGVMEKCSFCIQRIQKGKLNAKKEDRKVGDGEIKTACQQTCPTNAIVFGDANDPKSEVNKLLNSDRTYYLLEELNVQPSIGYLAKVRNTNKAEV